MLKNYPRYCVGLVAVLAGLPASAQEQSTAGEASSYRGLEEVVVTAQKRRENLQSVPLTVAAVSSDQLARAGVNSIIDLQAVVPGLSVGNSVGFLVTHLRGVGSAAVGPGIENPIGLYVDGVYYASTSSSFLDFLNVDNVQVLKGPQGTLFGRNATGGLIQVTTKDPTQETQVDAGLSLGRFETARGSLYLTTGITDTLAADIAVQGGAAGEGWGKNLNNGHDAYKDNGGFSVRSKWLWTPADATRFVLSLDYGQQRNSFNPLRGQPGTGNYFFLADRPPPPEDPWDINSDIDPFFRNKQGGIALRAEQEFDFANLTNIAAYRRSETAINFDLDSTAEPYQGAFLHTQEYQFSEELQLASKDNASLQWAAGLYYFKSFSEYDPSRIVFGTNPALAAFVPPFTTISNFGEQNAESIAGYGQATMKILPTTNLTLGARYTHETHDEQGHVALFLANGVQIADTVYPKQSKTFEAPSYRVALDHNLNDDVMLYASWSTGFKSGGYNTQTPADPPYQPEKLKAYEVGVKGDFLDSRLRSNLAVFRYMYKDIQVQKLDQGTTGIINGAEATIDGVDLDIRAKLTQGLTVTGSAEYLDATFDSFPDAPLGNPQLSLITPVTVGSAAGNRLPYASRWAATVGGEYAVDLPDSALIFNVTANRLTHYFLEPDNVIRQPSFTKLDAFVNWESNNGQYGVRLWGKNLTDEPVLAQTGTIPSGLHLGTYQAPRTYGVTFSYHFDAAAR